MNRPADVSVRTEPATYSGLNAFRGLTVTLKQTLLGRLLRSSIAATLLLTVAIPVLPAAAADTDESNDEHARYLRVVESDDGVVALEIAATRFESAQEDAPSISLVGVAHIGEGDYYDTLQTLLNSFDVVLYESIMPPGVNGPSGESDEARAKYTRAAMTFAWSQVLQYKQAKDAWPDSLEDVKDVVADGDSRYAQWFEQALTEVEAFDIFDRHLGRLRGVLQQLEGNAGRFQTLQDIVTANEHIDWGRTSTVTGVLIGYQHQLVQRNGCFFVRNMRCPGQAILFLCNGQFGRCGIQLNRLAAFVPLNQAMMRPRHQPIHGIVDWKPFVVHVLEPGHLLSV